MKTKDIFSTVSFLYLVLLMFIPASGQISVLKLKVVTDQANIRVEPDIGSIILKQVPKGTVLESTGKEEDWFRVQLREGDRHVLGYVHQSLVLELEELIITDRADQRIQEETERKEPVQEHEPRILDQPSTEEPVETTPPSPPPQELEPEVYPSVAPSFEIFLYGGGSYVLLDDLNDGASGLSDFYGDLIGVPAAGDVSPLNIGSIFGGELLFPLGSGFSLGVGADYIQGKRESAVDFQRVTSSETYTTKPEIKALPVRACIRFSPVPWLYAKAGVEYYFAECSYFYRFEGNDSWWEWQGNARGQGIGFTGSIGLDLKVWNFVSLVLESTGRYAKISGFEGTDTYTESSGYEYNESGLMYRYQGAVSEQRSYPLVFIREKIPTEPGVIDPGEAVMDFSGFSLRLGFLFKF